MEAGSIGIIAAVIFFIVFVALAMIVLGMIRRTMKLAFRLAIVGVLLVVAVVGAISLWWFAGASKPNQNRPPATIRQNR
jgi:4-amino-4-deoxy-L-arabinose transferase-like glycosyltransferase